MSSVLLLFYFQVNNWLRNQTPVNFDTQKGMKGYFEFPVAVTDQAGHSDEADVQIYLLRADQVTFLSTTAGQQLKHGGRAHA